MRVIDRLHAFCQQQDRKLLILLSYPIGSVWHACNRSSFDDPDHVDWHPSIFRSHLDAKGILFVDSLPAHVSEYDTFKLTAKEYVDRYYIGHYNPKGNHFFAFAIKDQVRQWLSPPPPAYQEGPDPLIRVQGSLPG